MGKGRTRTSKYWACTCYSDLIVTLKSECRNCGYRVVISPYHDSDVKDHIDIINGREYLSMRLKKPHYHLLFIFDNKISDVSFKYIKEHKFSFDLVGCECIDNVNGYARYLCHMDNPEKAQYDIGDYYFVGCGEELLQSPRQDIYDKTDDLIYFIDMINQYDITDIMTLYNICTSICPHKLKNLLKYSAVLEKFTRAMYLKHN